MVKKGTDAVMTTNKYRSDERMGVARLVCPGEEAAVERDTLPRAGLRPDSGTRPGGEFPVSKTIRIILLALFIVVFFELQ